MPPGLWALAAFYICLLVPAVGLSLGVVYASQPAKRQRRFGWFCMAAGILVYLARLGMEGAADQGSLVEPYY